VQFPGEDARRVAAARREITRAVEQMATVIIDPDGRGGLGVRKLLGFPLHFGPLVLKVRLGLESFVSKVNRQER
jgi:hypothetical protein